MSKTTIIALLAAVTLAFGITACKPKDTTTTETTTETTTQDNSATSANPDANTESTTTTEQQ